MNFSEIFRENVTYDDIKSDSPIKMQRFAFSSGSIFFERYS